MLAEMKIGDIIWLSERAIIQRTTEGFVNEHGVLVTQAANPIPPKIERGLFDKDIHKCIIEFVKSEAFLFDRDLSNFNRRGAHNVPFFKHIHQQLKTTACQIFGEPVKPSYVYLSLYDENGVCPFHIDRPQCKYTIDYCIDQDKEWPIWIDDKSYILSPNDAVCYSGTDSPHFREKIKGKYCWLVFFHFVPESFVGSLT